MKLTWTDEKINHYTSSEHWQAAMRELRDATVEDCCKAACELCRSGSPLNSRGVHDIPEETRWQRICDAAAIREMAATSPP